MAEKKLTEMTKAELYSYLKKQLEELTKPETYKPQTCSEFRLYPQSVPVNVHRVNSVGRLERLAGDLTLQKQAFDSAITALGRNTEFKHQGYSYDAWIADIKHAIDSLEKDSKIVKIEGMLSKLHGILDTEDKNSIVMNSILEQL